MKNMCLYTGQLCTEICSHLFLSWLSAHETVRSCSLWASIQGKSLD